MKEWIASRISPAGVLAQMLDLRREPMFSALIMTKPALRGEVIGRLAQIRAQYTTSAETLPQIKSIEEVLLVAAAPELPYMSISPALSGKSTATRGLHRNLDIGSREKDCLRN